MSQREGLGRLSVIWVAGTAGVYGGLYGFAVADRLYVVLGIVLIALTGVSTVAASYVLLRPRARARAWVSGSAEVREVSPPPESGDFGRAEMRVTVVAPGLPVTEVRVRDPRVPVRSWPEVADVLPVIVDVDDMRQVRVSWHEFRKPVPAPPASSSNDDDLDSGFDDPAFDDPEFDGPPPASRRPADDSFRDPAVDGPDFGGSTSREQYPAPVFTEEELDRLGPEGPGPRRVVPLEDEPTYLVGRYLFPTERYRGEWKRHWVRPIVRYVLTLGFAVTGEVVVERYVPPGYLTLSRAGVAVIGGLVALHVLFAWHQNRFVLTNRRIVLVHGVLRRRVSMAPLLRVTDMKYEQSLLGRIFGYGDFIIEGANFFNPIRRVYFLPNPNELYLRIVEEMYEPGAVEARLGRAGGFDDDDYDSYSERSSYVHGSGRDPQPSDADQYDGEPPDTWPADTGSPDTGPPDTGQYALPPATEALTQAFREAIYGPALDNYDGWVSVALFDEDGRVEIDGDRHVTLRPDTAYNLQVVVAPRPVTEVSEPLVVTGGADRETVEFTAEIDSDQRRLRQPLRTIVAGPEGGHAVFTVRVPAGGFPEPPWLWVRVSQQRRLVQSVELTATVQVATG